MNFPESNRVCSTPVRFPRSPGQVKAVSEEHARSTGVTIHGRKRGAPNEFPEIDSFLFHPRVSPVACLDSTAISVTFSPPHRHSISYGAGLMLLRPIHVKRAAMPTIALVDDDRNILSSVSIALEAEGYRITTYTDGASALDGFQSES